MPNATRATLVARKKHAEELAREWAAEAVRVQKLIDDLQPTEPAGDEVVIKFKKYNQAYSFAALKVGGGLWYITQDGSRSSKQGHEPMTWARLLEFIGERNWDTIKVGRF